MADMELELAGVDGLDEKDEDLSESQMNALEVLDNEVHVEPDLDLVDPGVPEGEPGFMGGKFKSAQELENYTRRLEQEREGFRKMVAPAMDLKQYGINLDEIPPEVRASLDQASRAYLRQGLEDTLREVVEGRIYRQAKQQEEAQQAVEAQKAELKTHWGEDYEEIMTSVRAEFQYLTPAEKNAYDTVNGALALGAKYQLAKLRGQKAATPNVPRVQSPTMLRSSAPSKQFSSPSAYTWEQIEAQSIKDPTWYAKNADKISQLSKQGRIK